MRAVVVDLAEKMKRFVSEFKKLKIGGRIGFGEVKCIKGMLERALFHKSYILSFLSLGC